MKLTYHRNGDYLYPDLVIEEEDLQIGKYGMLRETYLREHRPYLFETMLLLGSLNQHLYEIDQAAMNRVDVIMEQMAKSEGITETLKESDPFAWIRKMNSVQERAEEIVYSELIYC